ncbi:hypothetical protein ACO0QE_001853 [Hanseniaspora vineae]
MFRSSNGLKRVALSAFKVQNKRLANTNSVSLLRYSSKRFGSARYYSAGSGFHAEPETVAYKMQGIALAAALSGVALYMVLPRSNKKPVETKNQSDGPGVKPETPSEQEQGQTEKSLENDSNDESDGQPEDQDGKGKEEKETGESDESDKSQEENTEHETTQQEDEKPAQDGGAEKQDENDSTKEKPEEDEQSTQDKKSEESEVPKSDSEQVENNDNNQKASSTNDSEDFVEVVTPAGDEILIADGPKTGEQQPSNEEEKSKDEPKATPVVPSTEKASESNSEPESEKREAAYNPETGEINWDCPCLGGMAHGPCGEEFKEAFSCFVYSEAEPKGIDCVEKFQNMQNCFRANPEYYAEQIKDEEEAASAASAAAAAAVEEELSATDVPVAVPAPEEIVIEESNISNNPTVVVDEIDVESADTNPQGPEIIADPIPVVETPEIVTEGSDS